MNQGVGTQSSASNTDHPPPVPAAPLPHHSPSSSTGMMPVPEQAGYGGYHPQDSPHPLPPPGYGGHAQYQSMFEQKIAQLTQGHKDSGSLFESHGGMYGGVHSPSGMEHGMSPPPPPRVYKPCVVCKDKSSGYHYGVSSCEGCKGFFRRSVQKSMQYTCHKDKNCPINKVTRNRCQYCRLHKCLAMGMSKEAVRNDRNKKRKPSKPESSVGSGASSEDLTEDDQLLIQEVLEAHRLTSPNHDNRANTCTPPQLSPTDQSSDKPGSLGFLWEKVTELSSAGIVKIVDFAKKVPGFLSLSTPDQITLLKAACLEIMILRICHCYDLERDMIQFSNGTWLTRDELQQGGFGPLTTTIFTFAQSLKTIDADETEFSMLSAICLISGDRSGLTDVEKIEQMQEPLLEALKHYIRSRRPDQPHIFAKILMKMTDLRSISVKGEKQVLHFALDCISLILDPAKSKMQQEGAGPLHAQQQSGVRGWEEVEVPGPSGATATPALFSPGHHPASSSSFFGSPSATITRDSSSSPHSNRGTDLQTMSPYQPMAARQEQYPSEPLAPAYFLSYEMRQRSSSHSGGSDRFLLSDLRQRSKQYSRDGGEGGGSVEGGQASTMESFHSMVQKADSSLPAPGGSTGMLSPSEGSRRDSLAALVIKSESPTSSSMFSGDLDHPGRYGPDPRTASSRQGGGSMGEIHSDREAMYAGRLYPAPTSSPALSLPLRPPPPMMFGPSDPGNSSLIPAGPSSWRGVEVREGPSRAGLMPVLPGPSQSPASSSTTMGQGREAERDSNPLSISQLIGGALKMEPGDWISYDSH